MRFKRPWLVGAILSWMVLDCARAADFAIDLAIDPADWTVWGDEAAARLGIAVVSGDITGDGVPDVVIGQDNWTGSVGSSAGRVVAYLGPLAFPSTRDLAVDAPAFEIRGVAGGMRFGLLSRPGDVDGDGILDLLIRADTGGALGTKPHACSIAVFRGRAAWPATLHWSEADWLCHGIDELDGLTSAAVGDLDGDGVSDLALAAPTASGPGNTRLSCGEVYILFGPPSRWGGRVIDLATRPADVTIFGADGLADNLPFGATGDTLGTRIVAENILGDSTADLILGAPGATGPGNTRDGAGEIVVVRGRSTWPSSIDVRAGADFLLQGPYRYALNSARVLDWNADGINDLLVGAELIEPLLGGAIFGIVGGGLSGVQDLATSPPAWTITVDRKAVLGRWLELGDGNGDGYVDIYAGSNVDSGPAGRPDAGGVSMVATCGSLTSRNLSADPPELGVYGAKPRDLLGNMFSVLDLNQDGYADVLIGAPGSDGELGARPDAGAAHIILGRPNGPVCSVVAAAGVDASLCGAQVLPVDGGGSVVTNCSMPPQYRWEAIDGSGNRVVISDWSASARANPLITESVTLELGVRCGDCAGPCLGRDGMMVTVDPATVPSDLGNTLLAARVGSMVELQWSGVSDARSYSLHVGLTKGVWGAPAETGLVTLFHSRSDISTPPSLLFYRVAGAACDGSEGP